MWVGLLTNRINNKLEKSNLINEHALIREPVPLTLAKTSGTVAKIMDTWQVGQQLNGESLVTIPEIIAGRILAPITFSFLKWRVDRCRGSLRRRRNLTSVSNVCEAAPISLFQAPNKLNELPEMHYVFSFNLTVKSTMAFLTRQSRPDTQLET